MDELQKRNIIISKARHKYIPAITMNISEALELYLKNDAGADEQIPLIVTRLTMPKSWIELGGSPKCPECSKRVLGFRTIREPKGKANLNGYKSCWECSNCGYEKYSRRSLKEWQKEFKLKRLNTKE